MKDDLIGNRGPSVDPTKYPQLKCDKCGHNIFSEGIVIYEIPGIAVGRGTEDFHYPLPVYICQKCGTVAKYLREELDKIEEEKKENKEATKGTTLIL